MSSCNDLSSFNSLCQCKGERSLNAMLKCFEIFSPLIRGNLDLIEKNAYKFVQGQKKQNVLYTEVRYSPHFLAAADASTATGIEEGGARGVVEAVTAGLVRGCADCGVVVNQILCCINWRPEWADETVSLAADFKRPNQACPVVAVDIAAGEEHFDCSAFPQLHDPHLKAMQRAKSLGLSITLHAGENADPENVKKAVSLYGATRIGHGYRASDHPQLMKWVVDKGVHLEVCPTSSLETGGWLGPEGKLDWRQHPLVKMLEGNCSISINSDDPTVFNTSINEEVGIAHGDMGVEVEQIQQIMIAAMEASFASEEVKRKVQEKLLRGGELASR